MGLATYKPTPTLCTPHGIMHHGTLSARGGAIAAPAAFGNGAQLR